MKIKEIYHVDDVVAYSGLKDYFGHNMYLVLNDTMKELRLYGKNDGYKKRRKSLDNRKLQNVIVPEYLEVIDISEKTYEFIKKEFLKDEFPEYRYKFQIWE